MKKNLIFFSLLAVLFTGCSKDDSATENSEIPANEKFLYEGKSLDGITTLFSIKYNADRNVEKIDLGEVGLYIYSYDENKISNIDAYFQDNTKFIFSYDGDGHINGFSENGMNLPVLYNADERSYFYEKVNGDQETIYVDEDGDPKKFESYDLSEDELDIITVLYENGNHKGLFTNTNNPMLETCIAIPEYNALFLIYNLTKKPIKTVVANGVLEFENTFDNQEFLKSSTYESGNGIKTINFNYIKL